MEPSLRIYLHGKYASLLPGGYADIFAESAAEGIEALTSQIAEFRKGARKVLTAVGYDSEEALREKKTIAELHLVPSFNGGNSVLKIVIGVVLIVASILTYNAYGASFGVSMLASMGVSLVLGGLLELMAPRRSTTALSASDPAASLYLGAPKNTVKIGTPIPIFYGETMIAGQYLSYNLSTAELYPTSGTLAVQLPSSDDWQTPTVAAPAS